MNRLHNLVSAICTAGILAISSTASAALVPFSITGAAFINKGAGYGQDVDEKVGTLLDVRFSTSGFMTQNFSLSGVGSFVTFDFGTINMAEPNAQNGITGDETDNLDVSAQFTFFTPVGTRTVDATGTATTGPFGDSATDFFINWAPILVSFGSGGEFSVDLQDMAFVDNALTQTQRATITLTKEESVTTPNVVPEPSTIALLGLGLLGAAFGRRKSGGGSA